jgi:NadR type nicotinamide-nucleotide adenylyltransferase
MVAQLSGANRRRALAGVKRVVLIGSESTGKTTLARRLADHFGVEWVPEFVREYAEQKGGPLEFNDHGPIARGQMALEDEYRDRSVHRAAPLLVQDTDLLSTAVYCEHYYGECPRWIADAARQRRPDLYLLMDIDIPWASDPQRDRGHLRPEMQALFRAAVERSDAPFVIISGEGEERFDRARHAIEKILHSPA